ncbi:RNA polymerase sigma factor [Aquimarina rhabdastrellae]
MDTTEKYINALINGNEQIIKEIYKKIYPKIESFICANRGQSHDALDVFQDGLMYIIVTQKEKRRPIASFEAYLFVICKNIWKRTLKNRVIKTDVVTLPNKETDLSLFILEQECFDFYIEKFDLLSDNCKEILSSYFNGMSYEEILNVYAYSTINTVRQRVFKCRAKLMKLIKTDNRYQKIKKWKQI